MDMKRLMIFVLYAMTPAILWGWWNIGRQGFLAEGIADFTVWDAILRGGWHMLPVIITSYTAGGIAELIFCRRAQARDQRGLPRHRHALTR